ncbi:MAG: uracil-DNA glycosylase [Pseudomonadota bacterium]
MLQAEPEPTCARCSRLVEFRQNNAKQHPDWFNGAVPSFGDQNAELLIVGLAPGLQGANRTGRPFTGDYAGDLLYQTLQESGFAVGTYDRRSDDGLTLDNAMITNAVRCVPPQNKPTPAEAKECRSYLSARIATMPNLKVILSLGRIAHEAVLRCFEVRLAAHPFGHGAQHLIESGVFDRSFIMFDSYHCSRYNTNTGRLTPEMFNSVFSDIRRTMRQ